MSHLPSIRDAFLQVVESPLAERDALLAAMPPEVRTEVISLLAANDSAGDFLSPLGVEDIAPLGATIGPYRLLEKAGQGGMGVVYRARRVDGEFERDVAIKFVGGRLFAPEAERRFIAERRILALLNHPNIVHMIDGGLWQGQRYLVMEWVAGVPVTQFCSGLPLVAKLRLFREICAAIQYAHQHLVLHRDIKAANILVTPSGQVKVLDFGIARLLGTDNTGGSDTTMLHPMSLSCASPEQLRGEPLTLSSDIYALGLLLHEMLTGSNPQSAGTTSQIRHRIETGEIPAPSKLDPKIPSDLDAIVLKALSLDPERRYGSAAEMSADVGRFLDSRPVVARAPSRLYHATRFIARNKALTATALALVLAIIGGAGAAFWQAHRAEQQRLIAERRFAEARRLVYTVIHDIQPKMAGINGTVQLRVQLIEKTLIYLEALQKDAGDNPALMRELIDGYVELAGVAGSMSQANVGDPKRSAQILEKARALSDRLQQSASSDPEAMRTLARLYRAIAGQQGLYGTKDTALEYARKAVEVSSHLPPDEIAQSAWTLAGTTPDREQSIALYGQAAEIWSRALEQNPADPATLRKRIALVYRNLSSQWLEKKDPAKAAIYGEKARDLDEVELQSNPSSPMAQLAVAFDVGSIGAAYYDLKQYGSAAENWGRSVELREKVLAANPGDVRAADRLCYALHELARVETLQGNRKSAASHFRKAIEMYEHMSQAGPLHRQSLFKYASASNLLGTLEQSCPLLRKAGELAVRYEAGPVTAEDQAIVAKFKAEAAGCGK